jgi:LAS superfamily LD-carboxypeptidase LdcB
VAGLSDLRDRELRALAIALTQALRRAGVGVTITSVLRDRRQQARLYDAYIHGRRALPAAAPGTSKHERGLAFDMVVSPRRLQTVVGRIWERLGRRWGGRFRDPVHFE